MRPPGRCPRTLICGTDLTGNRRDRRTFARSAVLLASERAAMNRAEKLRDRLRDALAADHVEVEDDSARHAGHAGAGGAGHFDVVVVSSRFVGMGRVDRHRAVYAAAGDMLPDEIHALSARTYTPD